MPHTLHDMEGMIQDLREGLREEELLSRNRHKQWERPILYLRNLAAAIAGALFFLSLLPMDAAAFLKGVAYFFGAAAYLSEILLLTDCFSNRVPHSEMFMAYCFGQIYLLLGVSYLVGH